jgi:hypothetical protein
VDTTDKVKPIRPDIKRHDSSVEEVMADLGEFVEKINTQEYQPRFGCVVWLDQSGRVATHSLGEMKAYELIGALEVASALYVRDASGG